MVNIILSIMAGSLIFIGASLVSMSNTLWDILQELKKK